MPNTARAVVESVRTVMERNVSAVVERGNPASGSLLILKILVTLQNQIQVVLSKVLTAAKSINAKD